MRGRTTADVAGWFVFLLALSAASACASAAATAWTSADGQEQPSAQSGRVLAVTISGMKCGDSWKGAEDAQNAHNNAAAAPAVTRCTLHACTAPSADVNCQLQPFPHSELVPCEQGVLLISTKDIMRATVVSHVSDCQDPGVQQQHMMPSKTTADDPDTIYSLGTASQQESKSVACSSTPTTVSLLQLAAACYAAPPEWHPLPADGSIQQAAGLSTSVVWSLIANISLELQDFASPASDSGADDTILQEHDSSWQSAGHTADHVPVGLQLNLDAAGNDSGLHASNDDWTAGNLGHHLVLVDLLLPVDPAISYEASQTLLGTTHVVHASMEMGGDANNSEAAAAESSSELVLPLTSCTAGWQVWLARAGMVAFVAGLQLAPFISLMK